MELLKARALKLAKTHVVCCSELNKERVKLTAEEPKKFGVETIGVKCNVLQAVLYFTSPAFARTSGQIIYINGGGN